MRKRIKIELEDEEGTRYTLALEGAVSRDKLMKAMDMLEVMDVPLEHSRKTPDEGTFFGKVQTLLETTFAAGDFSSSDVAREFEDNHPFGLPIAFQGLRGSTPYHEATAVLLNRRRHELTILIKSGRIGNFNIDNEVCWHAVPFA